MKLTFPLNSYPINGSKNGRKLQNMPHSFKTRLATFCDKLISQACSGICFVSMDGFKRFEEFFAKNFSKKGVIAESILKLTFKLIVATWQVCRGDVE